MNRYTAQHYSYVNTTETLKLIKQKCFLKVKHANMPLNYRNIYLKYQGVLQANNLVRLTKKFENPCYTP